MQVCTKPNFTQCPDPSNPPDRSVAKEYYYVYEIREDAKGVALQFSVFLFFFFSFVIAFLAALSISHTSFILVVSFHPFIAVVSIEYNGRQPIKVPGKFSRCEYSSRIHFGNLLALQIIYRAYLRF